MERKYRRSWRGQCCGNSQAPVNDTQVPAPGEVRQTQPIELCPKFVNLKILFSSVSAIFALKAVIYEDKQGSAPTMKPQISEDCCKVGTEGTNPVEPTMTPESTVAPTSAAASVPVTLGSRCSNAATRIIHSRRLKGNLFVLHFRCACTMLAHIA
jgi:hypothetical protein